LLNSQGVDDTCFMMMIIRTSLIAFIAEHP